MEEKLKNDFADCVELNDDLLEKASGGANLSDLLKDYINFDSIQNINSEKVEELMEKYKESSLLGDFETCKQIIDELRNMCVNINDYLKNHPYLNGFKKD